MLFYKQEIGKLGENKAAKFLKKAGYKIVCQNFRNRYGEIDIIAKDKNCLVFVEVKTRTSTDFGYAAEAVNYRKQKKIISVAEAYLNYKYNCYMRFDIIEVYLNKDSRKVVKINHIKIAFMQN